MTFLFDSDMETGENGDYASGGYCALGTYVDLVGEFAENLDLLLDGSEVAPIVQQDPSYGWLMTAMAPVCYEDGTMAGYVMADVSMNDVVQEQRQFLFYTGGLLAALTLGFAVVYLIIIRRSFIRPIRQLTQAALKYEGGEGVKVFRQVEIRSNDELRSLADAFRMMLVEINLNNMEQQELAVREQRMESELQLARQLNVSLLPKALPEREGGYPFEVQGYLEQTQELSCCFYDYFLLDGERLCLLLGEVPGHGRPRSSTPPWPRPPSKARCAPASHWRRPSRRPTGSSTRRAAGCPSRCWPACWSGARGASPTSTPDRRSPCSCAAESTTSGGGT